MARLPGHEECRTCEVCGLTVCPDCDDEGQACPLVHEPQELSKKVNTPKYLPRRRKKEQGSVSADVVIFLGAFFACVLIAAGVAGAIMLVASGLPIDTVAP